MFWANSIAVAQEHDKLWWPVAGRAVRGLTIAGACVILALTAPTIRTVDPWIGIIAFLMVAAARGMPVAASREKPVTFTEAAVFAAGHLASPFVAGAAAAMAHLVHARHQGKRGRAYAIFLGAQDIVAVTASYAVLRLPWAYPLELLFSLVVFLVTHGLLIAAGTAGAKTLEPRRRVRLAQIYALSYLISFPVVTAGIMAYGALGNPAAPIIFLGLVLSAMSTRLWVENRVLHRQLAAVSRLTRDGVNSQAAHVTANRFLELAHELVEFDEGFAWIIPDGEQELALVAQFPTGAKTSYCPTTDDALASRTMAITRPLLIADASRDPRTPADSAANSWMLCPLQVHGNPSGMVLLSRPSTRPFARHEAGRLNALLPHVAVGIESARVRRLMNQYLDQASTDGLTGLMNHRRIQELLREELRRAERYGRSVALMMLDVDAFKQFNDRFGHPQGDLLLQRIARIIRQTVRNTDCVGRYGGEEFMVILPETRREDAINLAERVRQAVESTEFSSGHGYHVSKTVSIGVSAFPADAIDANALVQVADDALYRAKRTGKNRVHSL